MRMKPVWMVNTLPDITVEISQLAEFTEEINDNYVKSAVKCLETAITYIHANLLDIKNSQIDLDSLRIVGYSDAAFADNSDLSSQLGRVILTIDRDTFAAPIAYKSYKTRLVTRSVFSVEVIAIAYLSDDAFTISLQIH